MKNNLIKGVILSLALVMASPGYAWYPSFEANTGEKQKVALLDPTEEDPVLRNDPPTIVLILQDEISKLVGGIKKVLSIVEVRAQKKESIVLADSDF